jgi:hypothetical protein
MTGSVVAMILDVVVIGLLGAVLFFAIRLQKQLHEFREGRDEFGRMVQEMSASVTQAEKAIQGLRDTARASGRDLQAQIDVARSLSDEMQIITEAGDNLAVRLERASEKGGGASTGKAAGFAIRDPEVEKGEINLKDEGLSDEDDDGGRLHSRAERELYEALRGGRKTGAGRTS